MMRLQLTYRFIYGYVNKTFLRLDVDNKPDFPVIHICKYSHSMIVEIWWPHPNYRKTRSFEMLGRGNHFINYDNKLFELTGIPKKRLKQLLYQIYDEYPILLQSL